MVLPAGVWMTLALAVLAAAVLRYTRFGRHLFAIGSNERTARRERRKEIRSLAVLWSVVSLMVISSQQHSRRLSVSSPQLLSFE